LDSHTFDEARIDMVVSDTTQLFATGRNQSDLTQLAWVSSDAIAWERIPVPFGHATIRDAVITDSGIVVVGVDLESLEAAIWNSPDGNVWHRAVPDDESQFLVR